VLPSQLIELGRQALTDVRIGVANGEPLVRLGAWRHGPDHIHKCATPHESSMSIGGDSYFFSKKICLQSALPVFSAECEPMAGRALAVSALLSNSVVLPSAPYSFVLQSVTL
jgi:hypothetical protein